jgi:hypothetical protein
VTPRQRIAQLADRRGPLHVVDGCRALLRGEPPDAHLVRVLAGEAAAWGLDRPDWLRVWGCRGLLWCWDDSALPELLHALDDEAWRVRELACKVVARHRLDPALEAVLALQDDEVERVAAAARRAVRALTA